VVTMSAPGTFKIIAIDGDRVTIQDAHGVRKVVLAQALRTTQPETATKST